MGRLRLPIDSELWLQHGARSPDYSFWGIIIVYLAGSKATPVYTFKGTFFSINSRIVLHVFGVEFRQEFSGHIHFVLKHTVLTWRTFFREGPPLLLYGNNNSGSLLPLDALTVGSG
jgi:hypothetical protein